MIHARFVKIKNHSKYTFHNLITYHKIHAQLGIRFILVGESAH